jgi:two-component system, cell cycle sensor histidine kinase and response regulator CckA
VSGLQSYGHSRQPWQRGKTIVLIIEDEELLREVSEGILQKAGFQGLSAEQGQAGLALFQQHSAEIQGVLLDYKLPDLSSVALLPHLRALTPHLKVILCSGFQDAALSERLQQEDTLWFLQKPCTPASLLAMLQAVLAEATKTA